MKATSVIGFGRVIAFSLSLVILTSCSSDSEIERPTSEAVPGVSVAKPATQTQDSNVVLDQGTNRFEGRGKVVKLIANGKYIEIDHEDIPGYMSAMSMLFPIADTSMIHGIAREDSVRFQIAGSGEILQISRIGS